MELLYSVEKPVVNCKSIPFSLPEDDGRCGISIRNVIVFSTAESIEDRLSENWTWNVYVADLNSPWDSHRVCISPYKITGISWDHIGNRLLIINEGGEIEIWRMKDWVLNDWECMFKNKFIGEELISCFWYHNGKKVSLNCEAQDSILYSDKVVCATFQPTLQMIGSCAGDGIVVITASGLVISTVFLIDATEVTHEVSIRGWKSKIVTMDYFYCESGDVLLALSNGHVESPIMCYKLRLSIRETNLSINCKQCSSLSIFNKVSKGKVNKVKFLPQEEYGPCTLLLSHLSSQGSSIEMWELHEKSCPVNPIFATGNVSDQYKSWVWQLQNQSKVLGTVKSLDSQRLTMSNNLNSLPFIVVGYSDGTIQCLSRDSLQVISALRLGLASSREDMGSSKRHKTSYSLNCVCLSKTGSVGACVDNKGYMHVMRMPSCIEYGRPMSVSWAVTLLETCLVGGVDPWDVIVSLRPTLYEQIMERLIEDFNKQTLGTQQMYYHRYMSLRIALYGLYVGGMSKATDCYAMLMLTSVASVFRGLLRPAEQSSQDKDPGETLSSIVKGLESVCDIDKILLQIERMSTELTVEGIILQSLQHIIQWLCDTCLYFLALLPQQLQPTKGIGFEFIHDSRAISTIRELLVIIRMWGLIKPSCLPSFTKTTENLDVIAVIFKLVTKLLQTADSDESLLDECCLLPSQIAIPDLHLNIPARGVASPILMSATLPLKFEYGYCPEYIQPHPEYHITEGIIEKPMPRDCVHHIYLGSPPVDYKKCTRCCAKTTARSIARSVVTKIWDHKWLSSCLCGGNWMKA